MGLRDIFSFVIYIAIGIYLIVEAESVGQMTGSVRGHLITSTTPGCLIRFFGCMMLALGPALLVGGLVAWWVGLLVGMALAIGVYGLANRLLGA